VSGGGFYAKIYRHSRSDFEAPAIGNHEVVLVLQGCGMARRTLSDGRKHLSLPSVERELVVQERRYPYWDHVVWCGALANFAYLPATARPITGTSAGLPVGIQIVGPYLEDRTPIHAALLMDDLFGGFVRPPQFEGNKHGN